MKFLIFNFQFIIFVAFATSVTSCKSTHKSTASQTQVYTTHNSQLSTVNSQLSFLNSHFSIEKNGCIIVTETQTITEYDTSKPGNPIAKETKTEKNTRKGTQTTTNQHQSQGQQSKSQSLNSETHNSELITQNSELRKVVPVVQTTARWYIIGGIILALITLITTLIVRRKQKQKEREIRL